MADIILLSKQEIEDEMGPIWFCSITVDALPLRMMAPLSYKTDRDIVGYFTSLGEDLVKHANEQYATEHSITSRVRGLEQDKEAKQTEIDDMKKRLETLESASLGVG